MNSNKIRGNGSGMMEKLVTFAVAAYNSEKFLNRCLDSFLIFKSLRSLNFLDSVREAEEKRFEVLIVNDGSKDKTEEIALRYQRDYPELFRVITKKNGGHGSVINLAIQEAKGKYFKVIDADDWIENKSLKGYLDGLEQTNVEVVLTHYKTFHIKNGEVVWWKTFLEDYKREYTLNDVRNNWKSMDRCLTFHGITYRTDFYRQKGIKLVEGVFYEDHQYATIPCCYAARIQPLDCCLYIYRIGDREQSVSDRNQYLRRADTERVIFTMCEYLKKNPMNSAGKFYYEEKVSRLVLSYLVTVLLSSPIRLDGRIEARELLKQVQRDCAEIYRKVRIRYWFLLCCNFGKITAKQYQKLLNSRIYNWIRNNRQFQKEREQSKEEKRFKTGKRKKGLIG